MALMETKQLFRHFKSFHSWIHQVNSHYFLKLLKFISEKHDFKICLILKETYHGNLEKYSILHISREAHCRTSTDEVIKKNSWTRTESNAIIKKKVAKLSLQIKCMWTSIITRILSELKQGTRESLDYCLIYITCIVSPFLYSITLVVLKV